MADLPLPLSRLFSGIEARLARRNSSKQGPEAIVDVVGGLRFAIPAPGNESWSLSSPSKKTST